MNATTSGARGAPCSVLIGMTITDVLGFMYSEATEEDCEVVFAATRDRLRALRAVRAAGVRTGTHVRLENISPKYLDGLRGEVVSVKGTRCDVKLDERSAARLRFTRHAYVEANGGVLAGIPKSACVTEAH